MGFANQKSDIRNGAFHWLLWAIIAVGVILRLVIFFQNRNLIIDEANIVRNLAERGFAGLTHPLKYEQYAPPVFLWIEKAVSLVAGYGEKAMRFYSLVCGFGVLIVFYKAGLRLMRPVALLLPLALLSFSHIFIEYSACVKQYMPDALVALLLVWCALRWDIRVLSRRAFAIRWMIAGSIAIWASMPSVFILVGVGACYAWIALREKRARDWVPLALIGAVWLAQFALYYVTILKAQIGSDYLQNYHRDYFLFATPESMADWIHNWERIEALLIVMGGWRGAAIAINLSLMIIGGIRLLTRCTERFMLIALPIGLVLIAAALKQYSLIERVALFMLPLWLLLIGIGFDTVWGIGRNWQRPAQLQMAGGIKALLLAPAIAVAWWNADFGLFSHRYTFHEITEGMAYIQHRGGRGPQVLVHDANVPTYLYYTALHPGRARWSDLLGAKRLTWDDDYAQVTAGIRDTSYLLVTGGFPEGERDKRERQMAVHMHAIDSFETHICWVFVYVPNGSGATGSGTTPN